jgi:hypothetical protein
MSDKYLIKTKSGSFYPIVIKGGLLGKKEMIITGPKGDANVRHISEDSSPGRAAVEDPKGDSVKEANLRPGKVIIFSKGQEVGNTSRIEEVYRKVA